MAGRCLDFIQCNAATENPPNMIGFHAGTPPYIRSASYSARRMLRYVLSRSDFSGEDGRTEKLLPERDRDAARQDGNNDRLR
jgi:hypothetical protein